MKTLKYLLIICFACIGSLAMAQSQEELGQLMRNRGEYYFTINVDDPSQIQTLSAICSVDGTDGHIVVAYANQQEYDRLLSLGFEPILETPPSLRANVTMWNGQGTYNWDAYLTYPQYVNMMEEFPTKAIDGRSCTLIDLGQLSTSAHRHLLGVRINNGSPEGKPKFLYTSTMHGDEITGMILMLRLIDELCTSTNSRIVDLVNDLDIYIFPLTNPDGTYKGGNNTVNSAQRYNGNNIDLNRNYKDYYKGNHPDNNSYQEETVWTMAFGDENLFTMSANYHGGAEVMNYPWDAVYTDHADKNWYEHVCTEYVQLARQVYSSYMTDTYNDGVTNGATWYVITGSRQDYMNAYAQCREVTVECSSTKTPSASTLPSYWNYNHNSMLAFMEQALNGVHGFVYNAVTSAPIEGVTVTVENHDSETSFVTTHSIGDFHRPIKGGTYTFTFTKEGYYPESVQVTVADDQRVELNNVLLNPISCSITATANPVEGGSVEGAGNYANGETCTLTATAADDYQFIHWTENGEVVSAENPYSFEVTGNRTLVAVFGSTIPVNITISASPSEAGLVSGGGEFLCGETCTVTAIPQTGYTFTNWTENGEIVSENAEYSFTVTDNRVLVANFIFMPMDCYFTVDDITAGSYVMGYLNGNILYMLSRSNSSVTSTSATVTPTDYGFKVEEGTTLPQIALEAYGNNGQFYIKYNNTYLAVSSGGWGGNVSLTWSSQSNNSNARWYINANGIYITISGGWNNVTYYLYYDDTNSNSFKLSTSSQNNINFFTEGECPTVVVLGNGWNWWTPVKAMTLGELETALGSNSLIINSQDGGFVRFENNTWSGTLDTIVPGQMYRILTTAITEFVESGEAATSNITLMQGYNWFGYTGAQPTAISTALGNNLTPTDGDTITAKNGDTATFSEMTQSWVGELDTLVPGHGYVYHSNASQSKTITLE